MIVGKWLFLEVVGFRFVLAGFSAFLSDNRECKPQSYGYYLRRHPGAARRAAPVARR